MSTGESLDARLVAAAGLSDRSTRTLRIAALLSSALRAAGDAPVLVGGAAVEIYTRAMYTTVDFDFVAAGGAAVDAALSRLGFERRGRVWLRADLSIVVELPSSTLAPARAVTLQVDDLTLEIICLEDLVVDRLLAWKRWRWHPDGVAAGLLLAIHGDDADARRLRERAVAQDAADALAVVQSLLERGEKLSERTLAAAHEELSKR